MENLTRFKLSCAILFLFQPIFLIFVVMAFLFQPQLSLPHITFPIFFTSILSVYALELYIFRLYIDRWLFDFACVCILTAIPWLLLMSVDPANALDMRVWASMYFQCVLTQSVFFMGIVIKKT